MAIRNLSPRTLALSGAAALVLFTTWMAWPYLHAIVVRDAAVTSWISIAPSPISGYTTHPLAPGDRTGADGRIATITDPRADGTALARAEADLARVEARVAEQTMVLAATREAFDQRTERADAFALTFSRDVEAATNGATRSLAALRQQIVLDRRDAARVALLYANGAASETERDAADAMVAAHEREIADLEAVLDRASARHHAAGRGVFLLEDGTDGNVTLQNLSDARLRLLQAEQALVQIRAEQRAAHSVVAAARLADAKARSLDIVAPPGAMIWSLISGPGAAVQPGSPVASWIDCGVMLVDAPVSDVEASLVHVGSVAHVVIEGERQVRSGAVILTRGSAGALGENDLAAIAKGRRAGIGQVLVKLEATREDIVRCAIGHAAYVDFPDVGVIALIRARLRL